MLGSLLAFFFVRWCASLGAWGVPVAIVAAFAFLFLQQDRYVAKRRAGCNPAATLIFFPWGNIGIRLPSIGPFLNPPSPCCCPRDQPHLCAAAPGFAEHAQRRQPGEDAVAA